MTIRSFRAYVFHDPASGFPLPRRRRRVARTLVALSVAFVACAPSTKLTHVQVAPETPRSKVQNVLVVGLFKDPAARQAYEAEVVKALQAAGIQAHASQPLLPIGQPPTREALERVVSDKHCDSAVVGMLVDARTEVRAVPPSGYAYAGFYGYAGWAAPMAYSPGYLETTTTALVETRLYRTDTPGAPVFAATSESVDPTSARDVAEPLSKLVVAELRKGGFI
jgi:hypothetical protein